MADGPRFCADTGELLWETTLSFAGTAPPITYAVGGRQFVVIAAGGRRVEPTGGVYVAFALPDVSRPGGDDSTLSKTNGALTSTPAYGVSSPREMQYASRGHLLFGARHGVLMNRRRTPPR